MKKSALFLMYFLSIFYGHSQNLVINEVMSDNETSILDFENEYSDWIEIYNNSDDAIDMNGWFLSDDESELDKWEFPTREIDAGKHLVVYASGKDLQEKLHTNFKIKKEGEALFLSSPDLLTIHFFPATCIPQDKSAIWNRFSSKYYFSNEPTPGLVNVEDYNFPVEDVLITNVAGGFYSNEFELVIESENNLEFKFTQDGTSPKYDSETWNSSLIMNQQLLTENSLSYIPTADSWEQPMEGLSKATTIRAQSFYYECPISNSLAEIYFVGDHFARNNTKIFSLFIEPDDFFGDSLGIFVEGDNSNYNLAGDLGERKARLQIFDDRQIKIIDQDVEVENKGFGSRLKPQKSIRFRAKEKYGESHFNYPLFSGRDQEQYKAINLRSGMSSFTHSIIPDVVAESIVEKLNIDYQESELAELYINGEYWGIFDMRENLDKHYLAQYYEVDVDEVNIIKNNSLVIEGHNLDYVHIIDFVSNNDLTIPENYEYVTTLMDIQNYIELNLIELYMANWDWPHNNIKYWNTNDSESKFRWFFFDCDACLYKQSFSSVSMFNNPETSEWDRKLLSRLLVNETFKSEFTMTYFSLISDVLSPGYVLSKIDSIENIYRPGIINQTKRWHIPSSLDYWKNNVDEMRNFALNRPQSLLSDIQTQFGSPISLYPNPSSDKLFLSLPDDQDNITIKIVDILGKQKMYVGDYSQNGIDVRSLDVGMYTIYVNIGNVEFVDRFLKN